MVKVWKEDKGNEQLLQSVLFFKPQGWGGSPGSMCGLHRFCSRRRELITA